MLTNVSWAFIVKKRLSWISEMLQVSGTAKQYFKDSIGVDFEFRNARVILFHEYLDTNELAAFDEMISHELYRDSGYLRRIAQKSYQRCKEFAKLGEELCAENWSSKSNAELIQALDRFRHQALLMIPVVYFEPNLSERIRSLLLEKLTTRKQENMLEDYFLLLTSTDKELTIIREQRDLLKIGVLIQEQPLLAAQIIHNAPIDILANLPPHVISALKQHIVDYAWINTDDMFGSPWTEIDLISRLQYLLRKDCRTRLHVAQERRLQRERQRESVITNVPVDGELLNLVEIARENSHLRTHRTETYVRTLYEASTLINEVAERVGLTLKDALYLSIDELIEAIGAGLPVTRSELGQRKVGMAYILLDRQLQTFFGENAITLAHEAGITEATIPSAAEVEGSIANLGIVRGIVRIVHDITELNKVGEGDILVASMTIPEFVPAMEKAAAFVTDEGGITCHAAIVSREMDVPCIIGTEMATRVLRDGDFVEVDANNGIVRVLHSSNASLP